MVFYVVFSWLMGNRLAGYEIHWLHSVGLLFAFMRGLSHMKGFRDEPEAKALRPASSGWWALAKPLGAGIIVLVFASYTFLHQHGG